MSRVFALLAATITVVAACFMSIGNATATVPTAQTRQVRVHGFRVTVDCIGTGSPTVILFAGFGDSHTVWAPLQRRLAHRTRVCSYDRLGEGTSSAPRHTQTLGGDARLLHHVLHKAHVRGPLVLVGHSLGGDVAVKYARTYRRTTAGVVLFDATPVGYLQYVLRLIPSSAQGVAAALRQEAVSIVSGDNQERFKIGDASWAPPRSLGRIPLAVVEHGLDIFAAAPPYGQRLQRHWVSRQFHFARMSRRSELITATRSGHYIYQDQPQLALDVIRAVIAESRTATSARQEGSR